MSIRDIFDEETRRKPLAVAADALPSPVNAKLEKDMNFLKTPAFLQGVR